MVRPQIRAETGAEWLARGSRLCLRSKKPKVANSDERTSDDGRFGGRDAALSTGRFVFQGQSERLRCDRAEGGEGSWNLRVRESRFLKVMPDEFAGALFELTTTPAL